MDLKLKEKVVIVTGGGRGIGAGISQAFAAEGASLNFSQKKIACGTNC